MNIISKFFNHNKVGRHSFTIKKKLEDVKILQKQFPELCLCGSLALYLYGVLDVDNVNDIDMSYDRRNYCGAYQKGNGKVYIRDEQNRYIHRYACYGPIEFCLFEVKELRQHEIQIDGIRLQALEQVLFWKYEFDRKKDRETLKKLNKNICKYCIEKHYKEWKEQDENNWPDYVHCPALTKFNSESFLMDRIETKYIEIFETVCPFKLEHLVSS